MRILTCASSNATCAAKGQAVEANPDIAGIGVILGFLCTTCIAFFIAFAVLFLQRYDKIVTLCRRLFTNNRDEYEQNRDPYWRSAEFWSKVLSKNLLAFSDTQLLTGLAIQFTAMLKHCDLSIYHFQVVTELAFLTTVTHLLTLVALRDYFVKYRWINLPRVFFMLGNLALLGYTSFVAYSYDLAGLDLSASLACYYKGVRPSAKAAFGTRWAGLLIGAIGGHVTVILAMYIFSGEGSTNKKWWFRLGALFRTWFVAPVYATYGIIMAGISLRQTQVLGTPPVTINGDETRWGFGQFLPLLLLALPLFAGWESFWEEKDWHDPNRYSRSTRLRGESRSTVDVFKLAQSPNLNQQSPEDISLTDVHIHSNGPSPHGTPRTRSASRVALTSHPTRIPDPHLPVPSLPASPAMRPRSPSRFEERFSR
ncbi:hypothetical protein EJ04DRAFT_568933 [Polyplosphaeria fusca]|uniref:Uncharacterized protein n=1 Tax=Polyplosphaeria fusca TaxID=682080 RepID=A0A9P4UXQ8_9PLEO|nr:hypothetical protein EJ04DRAFT_568933 [Polyplosphaeria fusca]